MCPPETTVTEVEAVDGSKLDPIIFKGFSAREREAIRAALLRKLTNRCGRAFNEAGLLNLQQVIDRIGLTIKHSRFLYIQGAAANHLADDRLQNKYKDNFSTGRAQAGTVPHIRFNKRLTTDGLVHIYLHDSAFLGDSFLAPLLGWSTLDDLLTHELIHAGGQPPKPGLFGPVRHDLAGFSHYDRIIRACR
jgi:hypothetical protein